MNRREAYFEFSKILINDSKESYVHKTKYKNLIVKIYNDFENRSCKNCKYCEVVFSYTYPLCVEDINKPFQIHNNEKLSCNKWESK